MTSDESLAEFARRVQRFRDWALQVGEKEYPFDVVLVLDACVRGVWVGDGEVASGRPDYYPLLFGAPPDTPYHRIWEWVARHQGPGATP